MEFDTAVKLAIYHGTRAAGTPPDLMTVSRRLGADHARVREAFARLAASRLLVLEPDGQTIRMAPPFSGVPTQHEVTVAGTRYFANCAWDALGIVAALRQPGEVRSRCEESLDPLYLDVGPSGPPPSPWLFHALVPAAEWWEDIVFT